MTTMLVGDDGVIFASKISDIQGIRMSNDGTVTSNFNYNAVLVDNEEIEQQNRKSRVEENH